MEEKFNILHGAIGFDSKSGEVYVAIPIPRLIEKKGRWQVVNEVHIVTSDFKMWPITQEEQKNRNTFVQSIPQYPIGKEYWSREDIRQFIDSKGQPHIDPYTEVYEPIRDLLDDNIDFHNPLDSSILATWIMGTYLMPIFDAYPYILLSGTRGAGKTKTLEIVSRLAFNAELTSNATPSSIFRIIEANQSTILIDEGEMLTSRDDSQELRLILNAGYRRNNPVSRTHKETYEVQWFNVYSPKMIAAINPPDPTLRSRCLQIIMVRTGNKEKGNKRINESTTHWPTMWDALYRYALHCIPEVKEIMEHDKGINILQCRQNELWAPLLAISKHLNLYVTSTVFDELKKRAIEEDTDDSVLDDWHTAVLSVLDNIVELKRPYTIKEIKEGLSSYIEDVEELKRITSRWIGAALARFGLKRGKRREDGNTYTISREEVDDLLARYLIKKEERNELPGHTVDASRQESLL